MNLHGIITRINEDGYDTVEDILVEVYAGDAIYRGVLDEVGDDYIAVRPPNADNPYYIALAHLVRIREV